VRAFKTEVSPDCGSPQSSRTTGLFGYNDYRSFGGAEVLAAFTPLLVTVGMYLRYLLFNFQGSGERADLSPHSLIADFFSVLAIVF
jgi:hypothetical protein